MKSLFSGYYRPDADAFAILWRDATFILDANVLLNIYRYPRKARDELLNVFDRVSDRLWVPYQAALEYQRNRPSVIAEQKKRFSQVRDVVQGIIPNLEAQFGKLQLRDRHALINPNTLIRGLKEHVDTYLNKLDALERSQVDVHETDPIRENIDRLLISRIGPRPTQEFINKIYELGEKRYKDGIPPGFRDEKKDIDYEFYSYDGIRYKSKYGDLVIWFQIIDFVKTRKDTSIILLTDDKKDDWWWIVQGKTLGPRPELMSEIKQEETVKHFYMYSTQSS